jgi:hypothetical protein
VKKLFADRCVVARRLVEQHVSFVEVVLPSWDTLPQPAQGYMELTSQLEQLIAALIEDLHERGFLDDTRLIWMGEFGLDPHSRSPTASMAWTGRWRRGPKGLARTHWEPSWATGQR